MADYLAVTEHERPRRIFTDYLVPLTTIFCPIPIGPNRFKGPRDIVQKVELVLAPTGLL